MKTSSICPVCQGKLSVWASFRELTPNRMRCAHCETKLRVQMPIPWLYFSLSALIGIGMVLGVMAAKHVFGLAAGVIAFAFPLIFFEVLNGVIVFTYGKLIPEILDKSPTSETLRKLCKLTMSDVVLLLAPCVIVMIGLGILSSHLFEIQKILAAQSEREKISQQKWERALERLDSGKAELNYDKATQDKIFGKLRATKEDYALQLRINKNITGLLYSLLELVALGVVLQAAAVIYVAWRLKMRAVNSTLATQPPPPVEGCCKA